MKTPNLDGYLDELEMQMQTLDYLGAMEEFHRDLLSLQIYAIGWESVEFVRQVYAKRGYSPELAALIPTLPHIDRYLQITAAQEGVVDTIYHTTEATVKKVVDVAVDNFHIVVAWMTRITMRIANLALHLLPFMEKYRDGMNLYWEKVFKGTTPADYLELEFERTRVRAVQFPYTEKWFGNAYMMAEALRKYAEVREPEQLRQISDSMINYMYRATGNNKIADGIRQAAYKAGTRKEPVKSVEETAELPRLITPMLQFHMGFAGELGYSVGTTLGLIKMAVSSLNTSCSQLQIMEYALRNERKGNIMDAYQAKDPITAKRLSAKMTTTRTWLIELSLCTMLYRRFQTFYGGVIYRVAKALSDCKKNKPDAPPPAASGPDDNRQST
jgi:hypothetical protein